MYWQISSLSLLPKRAACIHSPIQIPAAAGEAAAGQAQCQPGDPCPGAQSCAGGELRPGQLDAVLSPAQPQAASIPGHMVRSIAKGTRVMSVVLYSDGDCIPPQHARNQALSPTWDL